MKISSAEYVCIQPDCGTTRRIKFVGVSTVRRATLLCDKCCKPTVWKRVPKSIQ